MKTVKAEDKGSKLTTFQGFAFGPLLFGPLSEIYGRKYPLFIGYFAFAIFQIPVAVAKNIETIMVCRFLGGFFGSSPLSVVGGALVDIWPPVELGIAMSLFAGANFVVWSQLSTGLIVIGC